MTPDVKWLCDTLRAEIPARIHSRDTDAGGDPAWSHDFESYLFSPNATLYATDDDLWPTRLRYPMKRALAELARKPVPKGRPRLDTVLWTLAAHDGNAEMAIAALKVSNAYMHQPAKARRWVSHALYELRRVYREDAPGRALRVTKSDAQLDAEAA